MTLTELRYVVALAEHRHFGRAAEACHVSQPTLSTQIRKLEEQLGITLFERGNKQVTVTETGQGIVAEARLILAGVGRLRDLAGAAQARLSGPLRLGVIPTLCPYLLPWLLAPLQARFPQLELGLTEDLTDTLLARLLDYDLDAALVALPVDAAGDIDALPLFDEPFLLACPSDHALAGFDVIEAPKLRDAHLMLLNEGHCLRDQAMAVCGQDGTDPRFQTASLATLLQLVAGGHGCTLLPALAARVERRPGIALARLADPTAKRRIGLVYRRSSPRLADFQALADLVIREMPDSIMPVAIA
ncbi:MAG TPA: LysR substrate-binding domain-containing protein [Terriglobales bacterium]|nr:LysR substrate-binding domain-containing protein [Terriglobales bacterium]